VNEVSRKLQPLLEDFRKTSAQANQALAAYPTSWSRENRTDVRQAVMELRRTLTNMTDASARIDQTLDVNSENIDELLDKSPARYRKPEGIHSHHQDAPLHPHFAQAIRGNTNQEIQP